MSNKILNEEMISQIVGKVISEETVKVNRNEYNKVQFKIEEFENQLLESLKELRQIQDSLPDGLKTLSNNRLKSINNYLVTSHNMIKQLKNKIKEHKKLSSQVEEKK